MDSLENGRQLSAHLWIVTESITDVEVDFFPTAHFLQSFSDGPTQP